MNTGLPCHMAVICEPTWTSATSTRTEASACTSALGFIWLISGHTAAPAVTAPAAPVATYRKSRRLLSCSSAYDTGNSLLCLPVSCAPAPEGRPAVNT